MRQRIQFALAATLLLASALVAQEHSNVPGDAELLSRASALAGLKAAPAVVSVHVTRSLARSETEVDGPAAGIPGIGGNEAKVSPYFRFLNREVDGSGLVWSSDGEILTSRWNIGRAWDEIAVTLADGTVHDADLVGYDEVTDVALLQLRDVKTELGVLSPFEGEVRTGMSIVAVGADTASGKHTVGGGNISAVGRRPGEDFLDALQHSARINWSNVGGPLVDLRGRLLGISVGLNSNPALNPAGINSGVSFAVPVSQLEEIVERLRGGESRDRLPPLGPPGPDSPFVGVSVALADDFTGRGVKVSTLVKGAPAEAAGILAGDLIMKFNGKPVRQHPKFLRAIREHAVGDEVELLIERDGEELTFKIKLGPRPAAER